MFSPDLERTLYRAIHIAEEYQHQYTTLEHLLLALIEDPGASRTLLACGADLKRLRDDLVNYIETDLESIKTKRKQDAKPTAGFQRSLQRAAIRVQAAGKEKVFGEHLLIAMLSERQSNAVFFLHQQPGLHDELTKLAIEKRRRRV